jgi:wobble nucleotide-excising tRNase
VLDDVFTSLDSAHFTRVLDLLLAECECFNQVILTTHSQQWRDGYADGQIPQSKSCLIELQNWSHEGGIRSKQSAIA